MTEPEIIAPFNYGALAPDVADEAREAADRIHELHRQGVKTLTAIGAELQAIKAKLDHGQFGKWLAAEFGMTDRTAQRYMRTAAAFAGKSDIVSDLSATTLYLLAAPSTPEAVRDEILARKEAGEALTDAEIKRRVQAPQNREAWLHEIANGLRPEFERLGRPIPQDVRLSVGEHKPNKLGTCFNPKHTADGSTQIFISAAEDDALKVAATVAHELIHAAIGTEAGHKAAFRGLASAIGLEGPMRATKAGEPFKRLVAPILEMAGPYPHAALKPIERPILDDEAVRRKTAEMLLEYERTAERQRVAEDAATLLIECLGSRVGELLNLMLGTAWSYVETAVAARAGLIKHIIAGKVKPAT